ncbi:hypothetical protein EVJ58_g10809 [Rhodofomes roseus]|uniref:Uncharacterized protein n=1 Tax=Rhodofomes roseus TaxID=34475 RepID=A0A4Y9XNM6_9APHY|nr:hypothetical protein EVJ58_g10809 [Rhodofomes roseus]
MVLGLFYGILGETMTTALRINTVHDIISSVEEFLYDRTLDPNNNQPKTSDRSPSYVARDTSHNLNTEAGLTRSMRDPPRAYVVPPEAQTQNQRQHTGNRRHGTPASPNMQHDYYVSAMSVATHTQTRTRQHGEPAPAPVVLPGTRQLNDLPTSVVPPLTPIAPNDTSECVPRAHLRPPLLPQVQHAPVVLPSSSLPNAQPSARVLARAQTIQMASVGSMGSLSVHSASNGQDDLCDSASQNLDSACVVAIELRGHTTAILRYRAFGRLSRRHLTRVVISGQLRQRHAESCQHASDTAGARP